MPHQRVWRLTTDGNTDKITRSLVSAVEEIPKINPHEVLVKVQSVALNYRDIAMRNGNYPMPVAENVIPCSDCAGTIVEIGSAVAAALHGGLGSLATGDAVVANFQQVPLYPPLNERAKGRGGQADGVLAEYAVFGGHEVVKVPEASPRWASVVCTGVTAWNALFGGGYAIRPGQSVLLQGTGGVSMTALQIAKEAGALTILTSSSDAKLKHVKEEVGVDHVINYKTHPQWSTEVLKLTHGRGVDLILENGGSGTIRESINALTNGGTIALIGFLAQAKQEDMPDVCALALGRSATLRGIPVGSKDMLEEAVRFFELRGIELPVDRVFEFSEEGVNGAYEFVETGGHVGKVCISVS